jgi:serine/threonine protein kinase
MCPEYFDHGEVSAKSDQYALGVVAFELFTGQLPFGGHTTGELMRGHLFDPVPSMRHLQPELPLALDEVVTRMLAKKPDERFADVADAIAAMRAALAAGPSVEVDTEIIRTPESWRASRGSWWNRARRMRRATRVTLFAVVASAGVTGAVVLSQKPVSDAPAEADSSADVSSSRESSVLAPPSTAVSTPPPSLTPTTGTIRIGSRLPLAALYVNDQRPRLIGEQGIVAVDVAAGSARVRIRLDGCADWDTTLTVRGGVTHTVGYRAPRC